MPIDIEMQQLMYLLIPAIVIIIGIYLLFIHRRICSVCGKPVRPIWRQCPCRVGPSIVFSHESEVDQEAGSPPETKAISYEDKQPPMEEGIGAGTEVMLPSTSSSAWLFIEEVGTPAKKHEIKGTTASIGTSYDNDVVLGDKAVSRHHAKIRLEGKKYFIYDLASTNGTRVNGRKITKKWIKDEDHIEMGHTRMKFKPNKLPEAEYKPSNLLKM